MVTIERKNGRINRILEDDKEIWNRKEEQKRIAKKTIGALEGTNGRKPEQTQQAKDRLEEILR